jgi:hypothetical protein
VSAMKRPGVLVRAAAAAAMLSAARCSLFDGTGRALLAECSFNDECESPLLCAARQCRAQCRSDRDCSNGWRCRSAGQFDKYVCYEPSAAHTGCVFPSDCAQSLVCANHVCSTQCRSSYDCRLVDLRASCLVDLGVCSNHPHLTDAGTLLDVKSNEDPDAAQ